MNVSWNNLYRTALESLADELENKRIPGEIDHAQDVSFNNLLDTLVTTLKRALEDGYDE